MLNQPNNQKIRAWKFLLLLPVIGALLMSFSIKIENMDIKQEVADILPLLSESSNEINAEKEDQAFNTQNKSVELIAESTKDQQTLSSVGHLSISEVTMASKHNQNKIATRDSLQTESLKINSKDGKDPLFIVDGKEISNSESESINPESIENITVLKGENAKNTYGEKGKNGVVEIKLKKSYTTQPDLYGTTSKIGFDISLLNKNDTELDTNTETKIRETGKIGMETENPPLIYKDGVEITLEEMEKIDPQNIKSMEVIKDKMATEKYGDKGKNGVILIHTLTPDEKMEKQKNQLDQSPIYQEGMDAFYKTIQQNIKYPLEARKNNIQGSVFVSFTVSKHGKIKDIKADETKYTLLNEIVVVGYASSENKEPDKNKDLSLLEQAVAEVIKQLNEFEPGIQNGKPIDVRMTLPVTFKLG